MASWLSLIWMEYVMDLVSLLFSFHGRINRLPYWVVALSLMGISVASQQLMGPYGPEHPMTVGPALITLVIFIVSVWIGLAVQIKRWHDRDKSGWWALMNLVPIVGQIWVLVECGFLRGTEGDNRFGKDPLTQSL
jgi:uncharacterized membrane protein YhaH (DUF805 family)